MVPSIDYLTLVIAGALLFWTSSLVATLFREKDVGRTDVALLMVGTFLFVVGTGRAFMSAFGL